MDGMMSRTCSSNVVSEPATPQVSISLQRGWSEPTPQITVGICAMDKKARSRPMKEIIERLNRSGDFRIINFGDEMIFNHDVEEWPEVQCLMSWHSEGFPLDRARQYANLRGPMLINNLDMQNLLLDRRQVYRVLRENGIPMPRHLVVNRGEDGQDPPGFIEGDDFVEVDGERIEKPFVEKPVDAENHNIYIYYPQSKGGGVKKLFRKVDDRSSEYDVQHDGHVRRNGSYIYEVFVQTEGIDLKVYTVGPGYAHAEARRSPTLDGRVMRTPDGKEMRFPVLLSPEEKEIARKVCLAFGQKVCGLDLLRTDNKRSYVCDVNGWSFVKNSRKYYDDAAGILRQEIVKVLAPSKYTSLQRTPVLVADGDDDIKIIPDDPFEGHSPYAPHGSVRRCESTGNLLDADSGDSSYDASETALSNKGRGELRCVLAVIRHGDRTPKQKVKVRSSEGLLVGLFRAHKDGKGRQAKLKTPEQLEELLKVVRQLQQAQETLRQKHKDLDSEQIDAMLETRDKLALIRAVLEQNGGSFSGINRKAQLKPIYDKAGVRARGGSGPSSVDVQEVLLIVKWGGILTHTGRAQAQWLGQFYRKLMYPGTPGGGLIRLHSTYRHDLKIYSSDEGRVQTSAAAFAKGLLDLEGSSLTPILYSLVKKDTSMLDAFGKGAADDIRDAKIQLHRLMTDTPLAEGKSPPLSPPDSSSLNPSPKDLIYGLGRSLTVSESESDSEASFQPLKLEPNPCPSEPPKLPDHIRPREMLSRLAALMEKTCTELRQLARADLEQEDVQQPRRYSSLNNNPTDWHLDEGLACGGERPHFLLDRWEKLHSSFHNRTRFDISKIPDIYDSAKYDALHNSHLVPHMCALYEAAKELADIVIPAEYGLAAEQKLGIGRKICGELVGKMLMDMKSMKQESVMTHQAAVKQHIEATAALSSVDETGLDPILEHSSVGVSPHSHPLLLGTSPQQSSTSSGGAAGGSDDEAETEENAFRLDEEYARGIDTPGRHIRTRIYFTSESHMHSLLNVFRYCQHTVAAGSDAAGEPLLREDVSSVLSGVKELDYLAQLVLRMYEDDSVPLEDSRRFRVEIWFSPGAAKPPTSAPDDHFLKPLNPQPLHPGDGTTLATMNRILDPLCIRPKITPSPYQLPAQVRMAMPSPSTAP